MSKQPLVAYLDTDRSEHGLYDYRRPHFEAARALGWRSAALVHSAHEHRAEIARGCDELIVLEDVSAETITDAANALRDRYDLRALLAYQGQTVPGLDVPGLIEEACGTLGLASVPADAVRCCNNKFRMRRRLDAAGLANVAAELVHGEDDLDTASGRIGFPLIFKPVFGAGSALIRRCDNLETLRAHYRRFRQAYRQTPSAIHYGGSDHVFRTDDGAEHRYVAGETALLEGFIDGVEATVECVVHEGTVTPLIVQEKMLVTQENATVLEHLLITPSPRFTPAQDAEIRSYASACIAATGLQRTFVHFEFRLTADGPRVIEINPRVGGFYVPRALKDLAGLDPFVANLLLLSGRLSPEAVAQAASTALRRQAGYHTMFVVYPPASGQLLAIDGGERAVQRDGILDFQFARTPRPIGRDTEEEYVAKFWGRAPSEDAVLRLYSDVLSDLTVSVTAEVH